MVDGRHSGAGGKAGSEMTTPSRDFLVRQSTLNALQREMPNMTAAYGPGTTATLVLPWICEEAAFVSVARAEYRKLVARFQEG